MHRADGHFSEELLTLQREVRTASAKAGYYAMCAPVEIGGGGMGHLAYFAAFEHIFRRCGMKYFLAQLCVAHWTSGPSFIMGMVTPHVRKSYLPQIMSGEQTMCFAMSEAGGGSDASQMKTRAIPDGDGWRLNGGKIWTTYSPYATWAVVFAVTNPELQAQRKGGISAFLVPTDSPGYELISYIKMFGQGAADEGQLAFDHLRVEPWQLIGELDKGLKVGIRGVGLGRIFNAARGVGYGRWALEQAVEYAKIRKTFGKMISEYQGVAFPLAEAATRLHAAHLTARNAACLLDNGHLAIKEVAMAKNLGVDAGYFAVDRAMQTFGAMGFTDELALGKAFITLRQSQVADGTKEILLRTIASQMFGGDIAL